MNELIPIFEVDGVPVTTSRAVAEQFGKRHDNVIQAIENILNSNSEKVNGFTALNFKVSEYTDISGKTNKQYTMTRDGFALLAMGFRTETAGTAAGGKNTASVEKTYSFSNFHGKPAEMPPTAFYSKR